MKHQMERFSMDKGSIRRLSITSIHTSISLIHTLQLQHTLVLLAPDHDTLVPAVQPLPVLGPEDLILGADRGGGAADQLQVHLAVLLRLRPLDVQALDHLFSRVGRDGG